MLECQGNPDSKCSRYASRVEKKVTRPKLSKPPKKYPASKLPSVPTFGHSSYSYVGKGKKVFTIHFAKRTRKPQIKRTAYPRSSKQIREADNRGRLEILMKWIFGPETKIKEKLSMVDCNMKTCYYNLARICQNEPVIEEIPNILFAGVPVFVCTTWKESEEDDNGESTDEERDRQPGECPGSDAPPG